jgi:CelD/BcsL family acetyltransferase involved in cellulose biosynthesis
METDVQNRAPQPVAQLQRARNAVRPSGGRVEVVRDRAGFAALQAEWDALVERTDDQVFYRHAFFRVWLDNFAPRAALRILTLRAEDGRLTAALPLVWRRSRLYGVPVRELCAAANAHSCRFDLLAEDPGAAAEAFLARLQADGDWDVLRLSDVPEGGRAHALSARARAQGLPTGTWRSLDSPYVPLTASWEVLQQSLDGKFRANLRRRRKRLEEKGAVTLERVQGGLSLPRLLDEGLRLEASGWKGRGGTAMAQDLATRGFYTELARCAAQEGRLSLWFLRLDGRVVAFHYALEHQGRYLLLKPAYDEAIRECSPGQLLMEDVLRDCVARGLGEFDFLGPDMPWKRDWSGRVRGHDWLFIFRAGVFGRALRGFKFRIGPAAREMVTRWKR